MKDERSMMKEAYELKSPFERLDVWQQAHQLTIAVYKLTRRFPKDEQYRLVSQLCRAASSVPANIVEGNSRQYAKEYLQFLFTARSSLEETKYHLILAKDLGYLAADDYQTVLVNCQQVGKLLGGLIIAIRKRLG